MDLDPIKAIFVGHESSQIRFVSTLVFASGSDFVIGLYGMPNISYFRSKPRLAHSLHGLDNASGSFLISLVWTHPVSPEGLSKDRHASPEGWIFIVIYVNDVFTSVEGLPKMMNDILENQVDTYRMSPSVWAILFRNLQNSVVVYVHLNAPLVLGANLGEFLFTESSTIF